MKSAASKFRVGDQVALSRHYMGYARVKVKTGVVVRCGFGANRHLVFVRPDGLTRNGKARAPVAWHMDYWNVEAPTQGDNNG